MSSTRWRLRRNCSLTPRQALAAWAWPAAGLIGVGTLAAVNGAWWIVGFSLLNVAALTAALCSYARHALDGDLLWLSEDGLLHVEQRCGMRVRTTVWRASQVRLDLDDRGLIRLWAGPECLLVGAQVAHALREEAVHELRRALCPHPA